MVYVASGACGLPKIAASDVELVRRSEERLQAPEPYHRGMRYHTDNNLGGPESWRKRRAITGRFFDGSTVDALDSPPGRDWWPRFTICDAAAAWWLRSSPRYRADLRRIGARDS